MRENGIAIGVGGEFYERERVVLRDVRCDAFNDDEEYRRRRRGEGGRRRRRRDGQR